MMDRFYKLFKKKKKFWIMTLASIFINGYFLFPLRTMTKSNIFDYRHLFSSVGACIIIAFLLAGLIRTKPIKVFLLTMVLTAMSMGCRYVLEFGETSTKVAFTGINILVFLITIPLVVMLAYLITPKFVFD